MSDKRIFDIIKFTVTEEHLKLLKRMNVGYEHDTEFGAPEIDPKRPYGNSSVYRDIGEILGIAPESGDPDDPEFSETQKQTMLNWHESMQTVLQILVQNLCISVGEYQAEEYIEEWTRVKP